MTGLPAGARGYEGFAGRVGEFASQSAPAWPPAVRAGAAAPNVVVVLVDDMGFSDLSPFGGEIETPWAERLAERGRLLTGYHTAPMCSPARAALLTGLNPHRAGFGFVAHIDPGYPGFALELPERAATLQESLRAGGYATFMVGKWHLTIESKMHDAAEKSSWPVQRGFDRYFGCMDGFTSLHHPHRLVRDNSPVPAEDFREGEFLTDRLTDEAIGMIDALRSNDPERPFFLYFAHTAVHGPQQAKAADIEKYRGRFDAGWDELRAARAARQLERGIVPESETPLWEGGIRPWAELDDEERARFARQMEVYAAAVDEVDQSLGRLMTHLEELGELDNTIVVLTSDNGGTAEGGPDGTRSYFAQFGHDMELPSDWVADVDRPIELIGGPRVHGQYPAGWARMSNTPFRAYKSSTYEGGVHAPLLLSWPAGLPRDADDDGRREQFAFVSDLAPTLLELCGVTPLAERAGQPTLDPDGRSIAAVLRDPAAPAARSVQYFECIGRRGLISGDYKLVSPTPPTPADGAAGGAWELYRLDDDPHETRDLAAELPELTRELARTWHEEAWANTVFPLDDDGSLFTRRRPDEARLAEPLRLVPFAVPLERFRSARLTVLRSFVVEAELELGADAAGVLVAHGDQGGGYLVAIEEHRLLLSYNAYGAMHRERGERILAPGAHRIRVAFDELDGLGWRVGASVDGETDAVLARVPMLLGMAPFTGISVGYDFGGPVDWELHEREKAFRLRDAEIRMLRYVPGARSDFDPIRLEAIVEAVARQAD